MSNINWLLPKRKKPLGISHPIAQEIRQEYFDALANRSVITEDKLKHGLTLERAFQSSASNPD